MHEGEDLGMLLNGLGSEGKWHLGLDSDGLGRQKKFRREETDHSGLLSVGGVSVPL